MNARSVHSFTSPPPPNAILPHHLFQVMEEYSRILPMNTLLRRIYFCIIYRMVEKQPGDQLSPIRFKQFLGTDYEPDYRWIINCLRNRQLNLLEPLLHLYSHFTAQAKDEIARKALQHADPDALEILYRRNCIEIKTIKIWVECRHLLCTRSDPPLKQEFFNRAAELVRTASILRRLSIS